MTVIVVREWAYEHRLILGPIFRSQAGHQGIAATEGSRCDGGRHGHGNDEPSDALSVTEGSLSYDGEHTA